VWRWIRDFVEGYHVSHETIYRSLFVQARGVLKKELLCHLRSAPTVPSQRVSEPVAIDWPTKAPRRNGAPACCLSVVPPEFALIGWHVSKDESVPSITANIINMSSRTGQYVFNQFNIPQSPF
jgi:hypothetical protein